MINRVSCEMGGKTLSIETGKMAKQADGSVLVSYGDTRVLVTACSAQDPREGADFFPLTVEFSEKFYAAGKIPGSFHKREGAPTQEATLSARMIDRPIRPLFPEGFLCDTQVVATILSVDMEADVDVAAAVGASAALHISNIPFNGPTAACRMGRVNGQYVINPTWTQIEKGETDLEILIAGTKNAIMMVEGGAREVPETEVLEAIVRGHAEVKRVTQIIEELRKLAGKEKRQFKAAVTEQSIKDKVEKFAKGDVMKALKTKVKADRYSMMDAAKKATIESMIPAGLEKSDPAAYAKQKTDVKAAFELLQYN